MADSQLLNAAAFYRMARRFPARTAVFTLLLPAFALFQLGNGLVNGGSLPVLAGFTLLAVAVSVLLGQYQLAAFERKRLERELRAEG